MKEFLDSNYNSVLATIFIVFLVAIAVCLFIWWDFFSLNHESIRTLFIALVAVIGFPLVIWRTYSHSKSSRAVESQAATAVAANMTDRFTRAIEQLGSERMSIRLGGIYALEKIAHQEPEYYPQIMEVLTAFVRDNGAKRREERNNEWMKARGKEGNVLYPDEPQNFYEFEETTEERPVESDIQAIMDVIGKRNAKFDTGPLNLTGAYLPEANLRGSKLNDVIMPSAKLQDADLTLSQFNNAKLIGTNFYNGTLIEAQFGGADIGQADFRETDITADQLRNTIGWTQARLPEHIYNEMPEDSA